MRSFAKILLLSLPFVSLVPAPASAWYCKAISADKHTGWASYVDRHRAAEEALRECAKRARNRLTCHIINCVPD